MTHSRAKNEVYSPLYCRYNGFMMGVYYLVSGLDLAQDRFPVLVRRMRQFLNETNVDIRIPSDRHRFRAWAKDKASWLSVLTALQERSQDLVDFAWLGHAAVLHAFPQSRMSLEELLVLNLLDRYNLSPSEFEAIRLRQAASWTIQDVFAPLYVFLNSALRLQPEDATTCFVAMPFRQPFAGYFSSFYRPALNQLQLQALRAWDGFGAENYLNNLVTLIARSEAFFGDLTGLNTNVVYEMGVARGMEKERMYIVTQDETLPSNLGLHSQRWLVYAPRPKGWQQAAIAEFSQHARG